MSKSPFSHPIKTKHVAFPLPRNAAAEDYSHAAKSPQFRSLTATIDASPPHVGQGPSCVKSCSSKSRLVSSQQLLRSPSDIVGTSNGHRGSASAWDAEVSSLPLGVALLLQESANPSEDNTSPRVALDPLPFSKSRARHFVMERMCNVISGSLSPTLLSVKDLKSHETNDSPAHGISAPTNRSEAILLADTHRMLRERLLRDSGVADLFGAAEAQAEGGKIDAVWKMLSEEMGIASSTLSELCRQVRCECSERGDLLETVGAAFQRIIGILHHCGVSCAKEFRGSSKNLAEAANRERNLQQEIDNLKSQLAEKEMALLKFHSKIMDSGVSLAVSESQSRAAKENFEITRRQETEAFRTTITEERALKELVSRCLLSLLNSCKISPIRYCSKLKVTEVELSRSNVELESVKAQLKVSEQRLLADSSVIEHLRANVRHLRIAGSWYRQCAFSKILSGSRPCDASAQTEPVVFAKQKVRTKGSAVDAAFPSRSGQDTGGDGSKNAGDDSGSDDPQENHYTSIQVLWSSIIRSALQSVLSMRPNDPTIELQPVVDNVCQLYCSKIAADLQADSSHIRRQTLPEFMYSTFLFQTGEPSAAKHALTEFISLVFYFETAQPRLRTFGKFLSNAPGHSFDALNVFLAALSFCNFDRIPIIGTDTVFVDSSRIVPCCDYIFHHVKQAKKEEICMEAKSKFATRHVNIDDFLEFIRSHFNREQSNVEIRLKAIFVGADTDGDGNMDIDEFNSMIAITHSSLSHQQLLRMYSEMTLNSRVDCDVFVRVARAFRFCTFESEKRARSSAGQEMWDLLDENWTKLEPILLESLIVLDGTIMALKLRESCAKLRALLIGKKSVEHAFICYNELSALIKTSIANRLPDQEINHLMAVKQRQKERRENLTVQDAAAQLQQELDF